ncbi:hypothetical protein [Nocardia nova]|uniref:hypothetical protein n=1 Tax=Nocardia nova TaxID=37330 RepID=UPI0027393D36|nr:hypothetical protein [Nocardia nova]
MSFETQDVARALSQLIDSGATSTMAQVKVWPPRDDSDDFYVEYGGAIYKVWIRE